MANQAKESQQAIAYLRTSSAANVGADRDSDKRQREAIERFADRSGFAIIGEFYDAAVSGADPIESRPGFSALLDRIEGNGVRVVVVEDASRFARDLLVQELGLLLLIKRGVTVYASNGDNLTETDDPMKRAMRQIAGVFAELEKHRLVAKLKAARDRKRASGAKVEGRKSYLERDPGIVALAKRLYRRNPRTGERRSLREISAELERAGYVATSGKPFSAGAVRRMVART